MPAVTPFHLRALRATGEVTASFYANRNGIPAFFPRKAFGNLLTLQGDTGARAFCKRPPSIELADGELDIDTPENLTRMHLMDWTARPEFA